MISNGSGEVALSEIWIFHFEMRVFSAYGPCVLSYVRGLHIPLLQIQIYYYKDN